MKGVAVFLLAVVCSSRAELVNVTVYGEALCPDTSAFVTGPLNRAVMEIGTIFTLKYVPWGNAKMISKEKFECQHGPMECTMNTVEACVIHYYPKREDFFPFLVCAFKQFETLNPDVGKKCAEEANLVWEKIETCYSGDLGISLEDMFAAETAELKPPHEYVPWVTINGEHDKTAEGKDLIEVVCQAFMGSKPPACEGELDWKEGINF